MTLSISDVAVRTGLSVDALRYYEREGLVPSPGRDAAGRRRYDESVLDHLSVVIAVRESGFGVRETAAFLTAAKTGDTVGTRLDAAESALADLAAVLDERAARLRRARRVVREWRAEIVGARAHLDPTAAVPGPARSPEEDIPAARGSADARRPSGAARPRRTGHLSAS